MEVAKLSQKYQIVVPKAVREMMKLRAGAKMRIYPVDEERALLVKHPKDYVAALEGLGKEVWDALGGADKYIREERAAWDKKSV